MNPLNPLFSVVILLIAFLTGYLIKLKYKVAPEKGRYESIDGMRGFLGLCVFIHHTAIWYVYIQNGRWETPKSNLYSQFGETSVSLFFMISSFLFISKLLDAEKKGFDWKHFFVSRLFRLVPMFYVSVGFIVLFVMCTSHWQIRTGINDFIGSVSNWLFFTITKEPEINLSNLTTRINAGVVWSLPYEWLFYMSLPLLAIFLLKSNKPPRRYIILSILFILMFNNNHGIIDYCIYPFVGGAIAPFIFRYFPSFDLESNRIISSIASILVIVSLYFVGTDSAIINTVLIAVAFTLIALGNTLFGLLRSATLKFLGEICYSTYLMHGIVLFAVFYFGIGMEKAKSFSAVQYCLMVFGITPVVVLVSFLGFRFVEKPFMDLGKRLTKKTVPQVDAVTPEEELSVKIV